MGEPARNNGGKRIAGLSRLAQFLETLVRDGAVEPFARSDQVGARLVLSGPPRSVAPP